MRGPVLGKGFALGIPYGATGYARNREREQNSRFCLDNGVRTVLDGGSVEEKKRFVRDFVAEIVVYGDKREVRVGFFEVGEVGAPGDPLLAMAPRGVGGEPQ